MCELSNKQKERFCLGCKHFEFIQGEPYHSDWIPGCEASMSCQKEHYEIDLLEDIKRTLKEKLTMAQTCVDFLQDEDIPQ